MVPHSNKPESERAPRSVRGALFLDYVRMIRANKSVDWSRHLLTEDLVLTGQRILSEGWYPIASFERLGNAILDEIACGNLDLVRSWGRYSVDGLWRLYPDLVLPGDPVESLMRLRVLRGSFFDFPALDVRTLTMKKVLVAVDYGMGNKAEEAAGYQTMGVLERVVELAGGSEVRARFREKKWEGDERSLLELGWRPPSSRQE